ncbi:helix-turn-helix domain-containing protein [Flavobacterium tegetincola]|uniref:helix-turn-helix domain-containing protein n=1 Tax=Flavobacterium tegetincola TaxID=150172 RepID=UPI0004102DF7|nr:helix-turn-helix transcriptional regulator [Flavobacterium tegetincola]
MTAISKNLRKFRERNTKYQQKDIAELLGIKQSTYSTWESGECDVKSEYIPKIAALLQVEIRELFENASTTVKINQFNKGNRDQSINQGMVFIITDENSIAKIVSAIKESGSTLESNGF